MAGMSQNELVADLKNMLMDAADKFSTDDTDFVRQLNFALNDLSSVRPRRNVGTLTLQAGVAEYSAPTDMVKMDFPLWGNAERRTRKQWHSNYPGPAPRVDVFGDPGSQMIMLTPPPTATHITDLGDQYKFYYCAKHSIGADAANTTVSEADRSLLLIRAAAQAMNELAANGITKPTKLSSAGVGSMPKNGTPAALADSLLKQFWSMAHG